MLPFAVQWRNVTRFEAGRHSAMLEATVEQLAQKWQQNVGVRLQQPGRLWIGGTLLIGNERTSASTSAGVTG